MPPKAFFEQDIGPGELFGEAALGGIHTRMHMAQAITHVDVIVIDDQDFMSAQVYICVFIPFWFYTVARRGFPITTVTKILYTNAFSS